MSEPDSSWRDWTKARPAFAGIHLDSAAAGRTSLAVQRAVTDHLLSESQVGAYIAESSAATTLETGRARLGGLLGFPADGVAFVESATAALQALLFAWPLPEHPSVAVAPSEWGPNLRSFHMHGLEVRQLPVDGTGQIDLDALPGYLATNRPSVLHLDQLVAYRGLVQPVAAIVELCHAAVVPVWIDASQALGHLDAVSDADAIYGTSRKWLCGPRGVGVMAIAEQWWRELRVEPLVLQPDLPAVARLESEEANVAGRLGLCIALQEHLIAGPSLVQRQLADVGTRTREALSALRGWRAVPNTSSAIVSLEPTRGQHVTAERARLLRDHQILVTASQSARAPLELPSPSLRISPHVDVTAEQLDALTHALDRAGTRG